MVILKSGSPWLFSGATGNIVGIKQPDGSDYLFTSTFGNENVEKYRQDGFSDYQTIQAANNAEKSLRFGAKTYTFGKDEMVLNDNCHGWICNGTTFKVADGAILNNNTNLREHTAIMRGRGIQGFALLGNAVIDGNRDNQTYPTNTSDFGRGTATLGAAGRRTNGILEFTPGVDNLTPSRNIVIGPGVVVKNAYLNGIVFWQCEDVNVFSTRTEYSTMNGIAGGGCTDVLITGCSHFRDGASDAVPTTAPPTGFGDRAGVQFREILPSFTAAKLNMPMIPVNTYAQINRNINVVDVSGEECGVETVFLRGCFPGSISGTSRNVGYKRLDGVDGGGAPYFAPAHFWAEMGEYTFDVVGHQTKVTPEGWMSPLLLVCFSFSGNGYTSPSNPVAVAGDFTSTVKAKGHCFLTEAGEKQNNFSKGALLTSCTVADIELDGCTDDPITIINDPNFNLRPPHDVTLKAKVSNCEADRAVLITRYPAPIGTIAGAANDIKIKLNAKDIRSTLAGTDDHALLDVSTTMSDYLMDNFEATDLVLDGLNASGNFNGVRLRMNSASRNVLVNFRQCTNMITAFRTQGFRNLKLDGVAESCLRAWLVDLSTSAVDTEEFDFSGLRTYDITTEMFNLTGTSTRKIKVLKANGALLKGRVGCRTWSAASITTTPDTFANQIGTFFWRDVVNDYGSSSPGTLIQDMRRRFSSAALLTAATPMYQGEIVFRSDTLAVYMARSTAAGDWSLMA